MVRIAPVRLAFNPKTLWFDAQDLQLAPGDEVVVTTARGSEFGTLAKAVFEPDEQEIKQLKSPLKPVVRLATDEDRALNEELSQKAMEALPVFRRLADEMVPDMNPIAVEYLFDGDKVVFYFESEERVDFRELVRKLAAEFHVRVDMKQIGVRDGARMVGGLGHCGQELCCRRLGGEFNPVSIRMAKEQDLSLNPTKISGTCGRLMCCLRYEYEAYKDFHSRAPKKNAKIVTPDGEGKVVDLDVPREIVSIKVGDEKPVKVPLADFEPAEEGARPNEVGSDAWEAANEPAVFVRDSGYSLFTDQLTGEDKLAEPGKVRHVHSENDEKPSRSRSRRRSSSRSSESAHAAKEAQQPARKQRRRRSTTVTAEGDMQVKAQPAKAQGTSRSQRKSSQEGAEQQGKPSSRRRSRSRSSAKADATAQPAEQKRTVQVGRKSSGLRANRQNQAAHAADGQKGAADQGQRASQGSRRRRRSHRSSGGSQEKAE